jgi:hypothetical protein
MQQSNLLASTVAATGAMVAGRAKIKGVYFVPTVGGATPGVVFTDGSGGATVLSLAGSPALAATNPVPTQLMFPENGILCQVGIYATLTAVTSVTVLYG